LVLTLDASSPPSRTASRPSTRRSSAAPASSTSKIRHSKVYLNNPSRHFGQQIIRRALAKETTDELVAELHDRLYRKFVEPFDGVDNGVSQYPADLEPAYAKPYDIFTQVDELNPGWNESSAGGAGVDERFGAAVELVGRAFRSQLDKAIKSWLPARLIVSTALTQCTASTDLSSQILVLGQSCPWKEHLFDLEERLSCPGKIFYVLYEDPTEGTWRIQAMPSRPDSFETRKALPEAWRGLRDAELDAASGIASCTFVHRSGFIGGNRSLAGAKAMALKALQL